MPYQEEIQKLGMGAEVVLYEVDMTDLGGPIYYLTPMSDPNDPAITFGGREYNPFPITAEGFEWVGGQAPPQPVVTVSNIDHVFTSDVLTYGHLIGGKFRRIRTFERFLDTGTEPDGTAHMPIEIWRIDRKLGHTDRTIQWELASWIDQQGKQLPGRIVIRDYCSLIYRNGKSGTFDYSRATCPYTGANKFDRLNQVVTDVADDVCSHQLVGCQLRFGASMNLPFGGFPGVAKFRIR